MNTTEGDGELSAPSPRARMSWAQLLKRVFAIGIITYPQCGGPLTILAAPSAGSGQTSYEIVKPHYYAVALRYCLVIFAK